MSRAHVHTEVLCGHCEAELSLKVTAPAIGNRATSSWIHADRAAGLEPEYCRDDDGSSFAADMAEPICPECGSVLEKSVHSGSWLCREHGTEHYHLVPEQHVTMPAAAS